MASLPVDRTKLAAAQGNQVPSAVISSAKNIAAITENTDSIDLLNQKLENYQAGTRYNVDGGSYTDTVFVNTIDGGTY